MTCGSLIMRRNVIIDTDTGRYMTGSPLGADIVDVVVRADVLGKEPQNVGAVFLYPGTLLASECRAWMGVTDGPDTASAVLELQDTDTGESLMVLTHKGVPGSALPANDMVVSEAGWYILWLRATNLKATASVYGLHLTFKGAV